MTTSTPVDRICLGVRGLVAGYTTGVPIVKQLNMHVLTGEIVTVVGPNGAGKSTLMKSVMGLTSLQGGTIHLGDEPLHGRAPYDIVRLGVGYVPQRRNVFPSMSVEENLQLPILGNKSPDIRKRLEELFTIFPALRERRTARAGALSGGERQMVAMAKALAPRPTILLLDEPTAGLSPSMTDFTFQLIREINERGVTIFMVEQNARAGLEISTRGYVLELGTDKLEGPAKSLLNDPQVAQLYLGGTAT